MNIIQEGGTEMGEKEWISKDDKYFWCQDCKEVIRRRQCLCGNHWAPGLKGTWQVYRVSMSNSKSFAHKVYFASVIAKMEPYLENLT